MQSYGLISRREDAEERQDNPTVPRGAYRPRGCFAVGEDIRPASGGGEDTCEESSLHVVSIIDENIPRGACSHISGWIEADDIT
jgi:hypothetical protein